MATKGTTTTTNSASEETAATKDAGAHTKYRLANYADKL